MPIQIHVSVESLPYSSWRPKPKCQERTFDPVLGRYRDGAVESTQRHSEERERVAHLNRAKDIQILTGTAFQYPESRVEAW